MQPTGEDIEQAELSRHARRKVLLHKNLLGDNAGFDVRIDDDRLLLIIVEVVVSRPLRRLEKGGIAFHRQGAAIGGECLGENKVEPLAVPVECVSVALEALHPGFADCPVNRMNRRQFFAVLLDLDDALVEQDLAAGEFRVSRRFPFFKPLWFAQQRRDCFLISRRRRPGEAGCKDGICVNDKVE